MEVHFFYRKPAKTDWSIEFLFRQVQYFLADKLTEKTIEMPYFNKGFLSRIRSIFFAGKHVGEVNHITGDIYYVALGLPGSNTILTIHDLGFIRHSNPFRRIIFKYFWVTLPVKRAGYITTISEATKFDLLTYVKVPENRIHVIYDFISGHFTYAPREFNQEKPRILQVGTKPNKNIERLIRALEDITCHLRIIGDLTRRQVKLLRNYQIEYSTINGLTEERLIEEYREADMVTFCSTLEGFGMAILEAQVTGRPLVTSSVSSMPEIAGEGACLVDPYDIGEIRHGIWKVINDSEYREELILRGRDNARRFSLESTAEQYYKLYRQVWHENYGVNEESPDSI